mmetsp:Transcript_31968/g.101769  ORF Transcript_31968/g.101769 Transcript_31968/m.101769 type:complete len:92 (+) Transcript_31968:157-432(+)
MARALLLLLGLACGSALECFTTAPGNAGPALITQCHAEENFCEEVLALDDASSSVDLVRLGCSAACIDGEHETRLSSRLSLTTLSLSHGFP